MQKPEFVTITGIDERTDLDRVAELSDRYPIEWGVLFHPKNQGKVNRYPRLALAYLAARLLRDSSARTSAHVCGVYAAKIVEGIDPDLDLHNFGRIQVNTSVPNIDNIAAYADRLGVRAIVQHRTLRFPEDDRVTWLYDCSGGRGETAAKWPLHPDDGQLYGYAGGLTPSNIKAMNEMVEANGPYYLDLESGARSSDDWLDLDKCQRICEQLFDT